MKRIIIAVLFFFLTISTVYAADDCSIIVKECGCVVNSQEEIIEFCEEHLENGIAPCQILCPEKTCWGD